MGKRVITRSPHDQNLDPRIGKLDYGAIVIERGASAEIGNRGKHVFHRLAFPGYLFEAFAVKHVAAGILSFGDAVGYQDQSVSRPHLAAVAGVSRIRQQSNRQVAVRWPDDLIPADP